MTLKIKTLGDGKVPKFKRKCDACMDCYANETKFVWLFSKLIPLGFSMELEEGYEGVIRPRSGNSKNNVRVDIGTIDSNYRGEVMACVHSLLPYIVRKGDRICQLKISKLEDIQIKKVTKLSESNRGKNGFGSSGK